MKTELKSSYPPHVYILKLLLDVPMTPGVHQRQKGEKVQERCIILVQMHNSLFPFCLPLPPYVFHLCS